MLTPNQELRIIKELTRNNPLQSIGVVYQYLLEIDNRDTIRKISREIELLEYKKCALLLEEIK